MKTLPKQTNKILTPLQLKLLTDFFDQNLSKDYFLTGGTALAGFYLFHRKSVDLDLFTHIPLDPLALESTIAALAKENNGEHQILNASKNSFLSLVVKTANESVKVDFVSEVPVQFGKHELFGKVRVDSIENIAVNKITAVFGRSAPKDFVDLYFLLKRKKYDLYNLVEKAKKKDLGLSEFYLAGALSDIQNVTTLPEMLVPLTQEELEKFFLKLSEELFLKIRPSG